MENVTFSARIGLVRTLFLLGFVVACSSPGNRTGYVLGASADTSILTERKNKTGDTVDDTMIPPEADTNESKFENIAEKQTENKMYIRVGEQVLNAKLANNSSVKSLQEKLAKEPITIQMRDYAHMEKVGPLGFVLPRNDEDIDAAAGDIILYQGNSLVIYYAPNSWRFTRLGKIEGISAHALKNLLGTGDVTITLSLR